jgi:hypothetical protein
MYNIIDTISQGGGLFNLITVTHHWRVIMADKLSRYDRIETVYILGQINRLG